MTPANPTRTDANRQDDARRHLLMGTLLACVSALGYTAANGFLKAAAEQQLDPIWVSSVKTLPTVAAAFSWLLWSRQRDVRTFPPRRVVLELLAAGLFGQLAGNVLFQWSLGIVGLAITVPLCFGAIICSSVLLGRIWLHESVTRGTLVSVGLIITAIWVLSLSASGAYQPLLTSHEPTYQIAAAVVAACIAGSAYGVLGMVIRRAALERASVAATTFLISGVGAVSLSLLSWLSQGWAGIQATTGNQWGLMVAAGVCNFIAFAALTRALQITSLIFVNAINATQVAMAALMGVLLFGEQISAGLIIGAALTVLGLLLMPRKTARGQAQRPNETDRDLGVENASNRSSSASSRASSQSDNGSNEPANGSETTTMAGRVLADDVVSGAE